MNYILAQGNNMKKYEDQVAEGILENDPMWKLVNPKKAQHPTYEDLQKENLKLKQELNFVRASVIAFAEELRTKDYRDVGTKYKYITDYVANLIKNFAERMTVYK